jgi:hypothetical protein
MTTNSLTKKICQNGVVAAVYFVITLAASGISYGQIQFRIAEILVLLCFFRPDFVIGVTLGCFLANINSTIQPWDMILGTAATFLSSLLIAYASPRLAVACIWPVLFNAFIVAGELKDFYLEIKHIDKQTGARYGFLHTPHGTSLKCRCSCRLAPWRPSNALSPEEIKSLGRWGDFGQYLSPPSSARRENRRSGRSSSVHELRWTDSHR